MMEALRQWLLGVTACALLVSLAEQLCPEGAGRKAARFAGGLALLLALLRPLGTVTLPDGGPALPSYREALAAAEPDLERQRDAAMAEGIAAGLAAYIEDKARSLGTEVRAEVEVRVTDGVPLPERVTLRGAYHEELSALLASELGLTKERQRWTNG